ncbi:LysE family translocator [Pseudactinotalea terrae]|uniref:LysE family translocator n=1 Tax=Pseudactinotalea terrae TaxID=1743262 RepID=UPI0012E0F70E|nr:LysE family translocator [Pseudactinotalea terrae]
MPVPSPETTLAFLLATAAVVVIPGPSVAFVVARSVQQGTRAGLVSVLGLETAAAVHAGLSIAGVAALLELVPMGVQLLSWVGAGYLLCLAALALRRVRPPTSGGSLGAPVRRGRLFLEGLLVDLLNPKTALFFVAFLPQFVEPERGPATTQVALLGGAFVLVACVCDSAYALLAGRLSERLRASQSAQRRLAKISAGVYLALAVTAVAV